MTRTEVTAVASRMDPHRTKHTQPSARQATSFHFRESLRLYHPYACACMDSSAPGAYIRTNCMHAKPCYHRQAYSSSDVRRVYGPPDIEGRACNGIKAFGCRETEVRSALLLQTPSCARGLARHQRRQQASRRFSLSASPTRTAHSQSPLHSRMASSSTVLRAPIPLPDRRYSEPQFGLHR